MFLSEESPGMGRSRMPRVRVPQAKMPQGILEPGVLGQGVPVRGRLERGSTCECDVALYAKAKLPPCLQLRRIALEREDEASSPTSTAHRTRR